MIHSPQRRRQRVALGKNEFDEAPLQLWLNRRIEGIYIEWEAKCPTANPKNCSRAADLSGAVPLRWEQWALRPSYIRGGSNRTGLKWSIVSCRLHICRNHCKEKLWFKSAIFTLDQS